MNGLNDWLSFSADAGSASLLMALVKLTLLLGFAWLLHSLLLRSNPHWRILLWRLTVVGLLAVVR